MAEEQKTLSDRMHDMWEKVTEPSKPGVEVGADLQAQAAAYDYANAEPTAEEAAKQAADLAATKAAVAHEETVSSLRGQGEALEGLAASAGSSLESAKAYAEDARDKIAESNAAAESSAHDAQMRAVDGMRDVGTRIADGLTSAEKAAEDALQTARTKLGL